MGQIPRSIERISSSGIDWRKWNGVCLLSARWQFCGYFYRLETLPLLRISVSIVGMIFFSLGSTTTHNWRFPIDFDCSPYISVCDKLSANQACLLVSSLLFLQIKIFMKTTWKKWRTMMQTLKVATNCTHLIVWISLQCALMTHQLMTVNVTVFLFQRTTCLAQFARQFSTKAASRVTCVLYTTEKDNTRATCVICSLFRQANWWCTNKNTTV